MKVWQDWRELRVLPFGGDNLLEEPAFVLQAVTICESARAEAESEQQRKAQKRIEEMQKEAAKAPKR